MVKMVKSIRSIQQSTIYKDNRSILLIVIIAMVLRVLAALFIGDSIRLLPGIYDEISYHTLAQSILAGHGYSFPNFWYPFTPPNTPTAHWSFLYPVYLAGVYGIFGEHPLIARIIQALLAGSGTSFLLYKIGHSIAGKRIGLIAATIAATYGYFIYYNAALMTESFFILAILIMIYLCLKIECQPNLRYFLFLGLSFGCAVLLRQTALFAIPILLAWIVWKTGNKIKWKFLFLSLLIPILLISPWTIRNYLVYHQFLLLNSNSGYALYAATNPSLGNHWDEEKVVVDIPDDLKGKNEAQIDRALTTIVAQSIIKDLGRIAELTLSKIPSYIIFWISNDSSFISNFVRVLSFGLYLPFMILGLGLSIREWRQYCLLYIVPVLFAILHILSWPAPRYRLPSDALMIVFAAIAINFLLNKIQNIAGFQVIRHIF